MQNTTIAQPGHAASSARSSQCNAVIFSAGRRPSVGNFWSYSELLKLLKPDPMLITRSVKCLSIPHKIIKRIEYTRQRHAKCQKAFECAINKHRIVLIPSEFWDLCKGKGGHLREFDQPRRELHCSFLQECGEQWAQSICWRHWWTRTRGTGVLWSNMTHYLAILYTAAIIYPCSVLTMTASYPYTRLEIPSPPFISLFTDFMQRTE